MQLIPLKPPNLEALCYQYTERSDGLHQSRIVHDILCTRDPDRYAEREGGPRWMNFLMGLMFEEALKNAWMDREMSIRPGLIRPGEVMLDGIIVTPDAFDTMIGNPEEYKCTKKSMRKEITSLHYWHYMVQLKAQCKVTHSSGGNLWVLFVNGNYSKDFDDPEASYTIKGWNCVWSPLEIEENWWMLVKHAIRKRWLRPALVTSFDVRPMVQAISIEMKRMGEDRWEPLH